MENTQGTLVRRSITRWREDWWARFRINEAGKAEGDLYDGNTLVRSFKRVTPKNGRIKVDIGTGSGVNVAFEVGSRGPAGPMRVAVYGSLKRGFWNSRYMDGLDIKEVRTIQGFKLGYSMGMGSFPVALRSPGEYVRVEVYEIGDPNVDREAMERLEDLDRLESNGRMYDRTEVEPGLWMYVGTERTWGRPLRSCPVVDGAYEWSDAL